MKQSKKAKRYYVVLGIYKEGKVGLTDTFGDPFAQSSTFNDKESGVVGVMPVFTNKKKAKKFAGKNEIATVWA